MTLYQAKVRVRRRRVAVAGSIACSTTERGAAIAPHAVEHADERRCRDRQRTAHEDDGQAAQHRQRRDGEQHAPASEPIAAERHDQRRQRRTRQPGADHGADPGRIEPARGEVQAEHDAGHAGRQGAQECGAVEESSIGHEFTAETRRRGEIQPQQVTAVPILLRK